MTASARPAGAPPVLQVFNRYLEPGGEEAWVRVLTEEIGLPLCEFRSAEWREPGAPPAWRQALLMLRNPDALRRLREAQAATGARALLLHNIFPVGSAALYGEAQRLRLPVIQYIHSFRPFSISGYLEADEAAHVQDWPRTYWREIRAGAYQRSPARTAWYAAVLALARLRGDFASVRAWIAPSDFMRERFIAAGVPSADIFTVRHFWQPGPEPELKRDDRYYVFLGRLVEMKGLRPLLAAWDIIARETEGRGPRLIVAGAGELAGEVQAAAGRNPLVSAAGHVSGAVKAELLAGCSGLLAPSLCLESLGLVAYEAYDRAKPVLAARSGALCETVRDGETGRLHTPGDAKELAAQVLELDADGVRRAEMGRAGRAWLLANTGREEWVARFERVVGRARRA
jgi:glycosyltransferase involved in cell wall biosynthesis